MRRTWLLILVLAVCALNACEGAQSGAVIPVSATSSAAPMETMDNTKPSAPTPTPTADLPTPTTDPAITERLAERWPGGQAIVVRAENEDSPGAWMWLYERTGSGWQPAAGPWPASVGKNGVSKSAEGDGRSPSGAFLLGTAFGNADEPSDMKYPYRKLDTADRWVDDPASPFYNKWVRGSAAVCGAGENLAATEPYSCAVAVHCNDEAVPGAGSAIFLHVWSTPGKGTAGCTAVSAENMRALLQWLDYAKRPVLIQGTDRQISQLMQEDWGMLCLPAGWGFADDFIPDAQLEIRYDTKHNFTGNRVPGYAAPAAPLRMEAIQALQNTADALRGQGLGIRIYDAYRPQEASDAMIAWAEDAAELSTKQEFYPTIDKADIPGEYVARKSNHRLGGTVDLTLLRWDTGENLEMGGPFDLFGEVSAYGYGGLSGAQAANRKLLRDAMTQHAFKPYNAEWWHFSCPVSGSGGNFPILPRAHVVQ